MKPSDWISIDEKLPEFGVRVLIFWNGDSYVAELVDKGKWLDWLIGATFYVEIEDTSHWMPIVAPEVKDEN